MREFVLSFKTVLSIAILLLASTDRAFAAASTPDKGEELVIAAPAFWCPFSCTAGATPEGFTLDILRAIFEPRGVRIRLINENYARALEDVRQGRYGATPSTFKEEAPGFVFPELPISRNQYCFYTAAGHAWRYTGVRSLGRQRVGIVKGYSYGPQLDQAIAQNEASFDISGGEDVTYRMARKVLMNRLDSFVEDESLVQYTMAIHPELKLRNAGCAPPRLAYLALSPAMPKSAAYAHAFDEGMQRLRASGQLERIMATYGLHDWP